MTNTRVKVLYIGGWGRSGSTLLGNILNEVDGFFHVGEIPFIWQQGVVENRLCGCERPITECDFWSQVFTRAIGGRDVERARELAGLRAETLSMGRILRSSVGLARIDSAKLDEYLLATEQLYQAIADVAGCRVIVDSSKLPFHYYALQRIKSLDVRLVQLVRDPRATAFSWQKSIAREDFREGVSVPMNKRGLLTNTWRWAAVNTFLSAYTEDREKRHVVRYEDFMSTPGDTIEQIASFMDEAIGRNPVSDTGEVVLRGNHTGWGNPSRSRTGPVRLVLDDKWKSGFPAASRTLVSVLSFPFRKLYGY